MQVKFILEHLKNGGNLISFIQKHNLDCSNSYIQRTLKKLGYQWDNSVKVWEWKGAGAEPLELDILELKGKTKPMNNNYTNNVENSREQYKNNTNTSKKEGKTRNITKEKRKYHNISFPPDVIEKMNEISDETYLSINALTVLAAQSLVANWERKGMFIFADILNPYNDK